MQQLCAWADETSRWVADERAAAATAHAEAQTVLVDSAGRLRTLLPEHELRGTALNAADLSGLPALAIPPRRPRPAPTRSPSRSTPTPSERSRGGPSCSSSATPPSSSSSWPASWPSCCRPAGSWTG